ncbi:DUF4139 domain-containing protein [Streptomyces sp. NBC_01341]|uniref:DUF4139 domain-containing protein n=1 Tax=Streptomyces sp. NBC_01341 TaxID=2903831 RepID=UPI002E12A7D2|nr:DUF4139 domain-containing protein [Streptomyces sp. NBC_01341]
MTTETAQRWGSALDSVVVYEQGALCRRLARGSAGPFGSVRVVGLPRSMDPDSLRVRVLGPAGVRVSEARVEIEAETLDASGQDELQAEVDRLSDACAAVRGRRDRTLGLIEEIGALRPVPPPRKRDEPHRRTPVDAWLELGCFVDDRLRGLHDTLGELEESVRRAAHALDLALDRQARASTDSGTDAASAHLRTTVSAVVTVDVPDTCDARAEVELELEYGVPGAVWVPAYRLAHRRGEPTGRMTLRASIAQRTGEDWTGVAVGLATADLRRDTGLPKLRSIRIGRRQPSPEPSGWREPPPGLGELFAGYDVAGPRPGTAAGPASARVGSAPPPPSAPQAYGGDLPAAPAAPVPGGPAGAATERFGGGAPAPVQPGRARSGGRSFAAAAPVAPPVPGGAMPSAPPAPVSGPPQPRGAELDYAALVLSGPEEPGARRGRLFTGSPFDPVAEEHRRRAESVAGLPLPGHAVRPRESAGSFDHRFDTASRADIPSDGTWHTVTIGEIPIGLETEYLCVPSVEQTVYATLVVSNSTGQALLAGPVEVTVDDEFLLTTALPTLAPGGVRRVGLGRAEGIEVTRRTTVRESTSGLRNNVTVLDHQVRLELANRLTRPVVLEVRERVPVTSEADVRIEERAGWITPEDGQGQDHHAPGTRIRRVDLPAGGTAALDGGYEIRIPSGKAIVGGNRRS